MAFGKSGDKTIQFIAILFAIYTIKVAIEVDDKFLLLIGLSTMFYDGYLFLFETV